MRATGASRRTSAMGRFRRFDCGPANDRSWRIPEVLPAAFDGRLRLQSGLREVVQARVYGVHALILCGQLHRPNVFQDSPKIRLRREAHSSISVQEGQPHSLLILLHFISFRLRRNSSEMSAGYSPSITMVRFQRRKTAA
jgi:hypothetical protein